MKTRLNATGDRMNEIDDGYIKDILSRHQLHLQDFELLIDRAESTLSNNGSGDIKITKSNIEKGERLHCHKLSPEMRDILVTLAKQSFARCRGITMPQHILMGVYQQAMKIFDMQKFSCVVNRPQAIYNRLRDGVELLA